MLLNHLDVLEKLAQAFQRVVLALYRNEDFAGSAECVDGEQTQARGAIDKDEVQPVLAVLRPFLGVDVNGPAKSLLTSNQRHEFDLRAGQVDRGRRADQVGNVGALSDDVLQRKIINEDVVNAVDVGVVLDAKSGRCVALGIDVDNKNVKAADARAAAMFTVVVVLPTPPFWLETVKIRVPSGLGNSRPISLSRRRVSLANCRAMGLESSMESMTFCAPFETVSRETAAFSTDLVCTIAD